MNILKNVELQHCECCTNVAKCRFNIEKNIHTLTFNIATSQRRSFNVLCYMLIAAQNFLDSH